MPDDAGLYERDWHAWTQDRAARLRAWPEYLRPNGLDVEHLAEIDDFRAQLEVEFRDSPSLRARRQELSGTAWRKGVQAFLRQLGREAPEAARRLAEAVPTDAPPRYDLDAQLLDEDWYPAPLPP